MNAMDGTDLLVETLPASSHSMRIACVTETYPPEVNGVAMSLARIIEELRQRRHDVQLVRPRQSPAEVADGSARFSEVLMRGLPIPAYPNLKMGLPARRALQRLWTLQRPDVVYIATEGPLGWSALQAASKLRLPIASDFRTNFHAYSKHYGAAWLCRPIVAYLRKFHNRTHCTMVPTDALQRELADSGFRRLAVVARGVDLRRFHPSWRSSALRESWGAAEHDLVMLYVGRLAPEKNLGALADAYAAARAVAPRTRLVIAGDGPSRRELAQRCPDAIFAGQIRGDDLSRHYASADLFAFPSLTETFGNVTIEAMASGLPVVAFDHAAAAQLVEPGVHGLLAPYGDNAAFVAHAAALAGDAPRRAAMALRAQPRAAGMDWRNIAAQFEGVLSRVILEAQSTHATIGLSLRVPA